MKQFRAVNWTVFWKIPSENVKIEGKNHLVKRRLAYVSLSKTLTVLERELHFSFISYETTELFSDMHSYNVEPAHFEVVFYMNVRWPLIQGCELSNESRTNYLKPLQPVII